MRYGVLADIHANLAALEAVVEELTRQGAERWIVTGDLVGYGAEPNECVEVVAALDAVTVAGNHDLIALGRLPDTRCIQLARDSHTWMRSRLGADARAYLEALPVTRLADGGVLVAHGSLVDPERYISTEAQALEQLADLHRHPGADVVVLGHTHRPLAVGSRAGRLDARGVVPLPDPDPVLLNPGSVGQSRELRPLARGLLLDLDARSATFVRIRYDIGRARASLRAAGLSTRGCHLRPGLGGAVRRVRAVVRRRRPTIGAAR